MNTILVQMDRTAGLGNFARVASRQIRANLEGTLAKPELQGLLMQPAPRPQPTWLPAPVYRPRVVTADGQGRGGAAKKVSWVQVSSHNFTPAERVTWCVLALASVGGIGYGLTCLLDLVQNWAQFTLGMAHFIH